MFSGTPHVHVGSPAAKFPMEDVKLVHFHDFKNLTTTRGEAVESPEFECAGHKWKLQLYPGGSDSSGDGFVSVSLLASLPSESSEIKLRDFTINIKKSNGQNYTEDDYWETYGSYVETTVFDSNNPSDGPANFLKHDDVLDEDSEILHFGSLTIEVRMRLHTDDYCIADKQPSSLKDDMLKLFFEENTEDVAFKVKGKIVKAHRTVLRAHVKELAELCEAFSLSKPMQIDDVNPDIFQLMIGYVYGEMIPTETWRKQVQFITNPMKHNKSILYAAGKYGFTALKSKAEAWCVKFLELDADTAIVHLLYADANSLPLMKKVAMESIIRHGKGIMASESFPLLNESPVLMKEVMAELMEQLETLKRKRDE